MASLANTYYLIDDYAGSTGGAGGGASGQPISPTFTTTTLLDAQVIAQQFSQVFNRPCRLVQLGSTPPWTPLYTPSSCRVLPSPVPQTVLY